MLRDDQRWMLVERLREQEIRDTRLADEGGDGSRSDFASYRALAAGYNVDWVRAHAYLGRKARGYAGQLIEALRISCLLPSGASVLDIGCGPGEITDSLRVLRGSDAFGADISSSAIDYARRHFPDCRFEVIGVEAETWLGRRFSLVHAREFYPFTRTADISHQEGYLAALARHVEPGGTLALTLLCGEQSLASNCDQLVPALGRLGLTPLRRLPLPFAELGTVGPWALRLGATRALNAVLGRLQSAVFVARKSVSA